MSEWDDELFDEEFPGGDDPPVDVVPCPNCGAEVYEEAERCPACGDYIVHGGGRSAWEGKPLWWILLGLAGIGATVVILSGWGVF